MKFRTTWDLMSNKVQCVEHIDPDTPSMTEKCPPFNIVKLLNSMTKGEALQILGFDGYVDSDVGEEDILENASAFDDDSADAIDRFEELCQNVVAQSSKNKEKLSAGDVTKQQSQADTTLTDEVGKEINSPS